MQLKEWLNQRDMTIEEFAIIGGFSYGAVAKWVTGERFPRVPALQRIEQITDGKVSVGDFFAQSKQISE